MKGYSKIKLMNSSSSKSKSMDSSDPTIEKPNISIKKSTITITQPQANNLDDDYDYDYNQYSANNQQQDENFSTGKLRINRSSVTSDHGTTTDANGTSSLSSRFKIEKQHSTGRTLQTAVKSVVSIRRSSSVSERYSRIHDQCSNDPFDVEEVDDEHVARSKKNMKKRSSGRIFKACKRVFGL